LTTVLHLKYKGKIFPRGGKFQREKFPAGVIFSLLKLATVPNSNMAPEERGSRDLGSGGSNFILGETITSPGTKLPIITIFINLGYWRYNSQIWRSKSN